MRAISMKRELNASCKLVSELAPRRGQGVFGCDLAIDPGTHTGWACFVENKLETCGLGAPLLDVRRIVIEIPQVYPAHPVPPNDLVTLAFLAGRYVGGARVGAEVYTVFPHQWKGNLSKEACAARVRFRLSAEEKKVVDDLRVPAKQLHNVMDAIGIGLFALGRGVA
jgi:hypothetical protein